METPSRPPEKFMVVAVALAVGIAVGATLGLIGAGGAVLAVPAFLYIFGFSPIAATTASLAVVAASAASGVIPRLRMHQVAVKQALLFWALGILGTLGGSRLAPLLPESLLVTGFAAVMAAAAIAMWRKANAGVPPPDRRRATWLLPVVAIAIGVLTGLFGVGGGFLIVPALVLVFDLPFGRAAGTSLAVVALNSITALLFKADSWSSVDWWIPLLIIVGGVSASVVASRWNARVSRRILERGFALMLVLLAIWMIVQALILG